MAAREAAREPALEPARELKHADGTTVTAQEAYDAFMNTRVLIVTANNADEAVSMEWYDTNSMQDNPAAVGFVKLKFVLDSPEGSVRLAAIDVGDSSIVPEQQG